MFEEFGTNWDTLSLAGKTSRTRGRALQPPTWQHVSEATTGHEGRHGGAHVPRHRVLAYTAAGIATRKGSGERDTGGGGVPRQTSVLD